MNSENEKKDAKEMLPGIDINFEGAENGPENEKPVEDLAREAQEAAKQTEENSELAKSRIPEIGEPESSEEASIELQEIEKETTGAKEALKSDLDKAMGENQEEGVPEQEQTKPTHKENSEEEKPKMENSTPENTETENPKTENSEEERVESIELEISKEQVNEILGQDPHSALQKLKEILRQQGKELPEQTEEASLFEVQEDGRMLFSYKAGKESISIRAEMLEGGNAKIEIGTVENPEDSPAEKELEEFKKLLFGNEDISDMVEMNNEQYRQMMEEREAFGAKSEEEKLQEIRKFKRDFEATFVEHNIENEEKFNAKGEVIDRELEANQEIFKQLYESNSDILNSENPEDIEKVNKFLFSLADKAEYFAEIIMMRYKNTGEQDLIMEGRHINMLQAIKNLQEAARILRKGIDKMTQEDRQVLEKSKSLWKYLIPGLLLLLGVLAYCAKEIVPPTVATIGGTALGFGGYKVGTIAWPVVTSKPAIGLFGMFILSNLMGEKMDNFVETITGVKIHPALRSGKKDSK